MRKTEKSEIQGNRPVSVEDLKKEVKKERLHIWENCRTDVKGNREVII
jgi:hypothetical protein